MAGIRASAEELCLRRLARVSVLWRKKQHLIEETGRLTADEIFDSAYIGRYWWLCLIMHSSRHKEEPITQLGEPQNAESRGEQLKPGVHCTCTMTELLYMPFPQSA